MNKLFTLGFLISLCASCDFDEAYNVIPCENTFDRMFAFCDTTFQKRSWGMAPIGFQAKGDYDSSSVVCSKWNIKLGLQTCDQAILDPTYIQALSESIFNDSVNLNINTIHLTLDECHLQNGQKYAEYQLSRDDLAIGIPPLPRKHEIQVVEFTGYSTNSLDHDTAGHFLIDYLPENPDSIARLIWSENRNYSGIHMEVQNTNSSVCERIYFTYMFK